MTSQIRAFINNPCSEELPSLDEVPGGQDGPWLPYAPGCAGDAEVEPGCGNEMMWGISSAPASWEKPKCALWEGKTGITPVLPEITPALPPLQCGAGTLANQSTATCEIACSSSSSGRMLEVASDSSALSVEDLSSEAATALLVAGDITDAHLTADLVLKLAAHHLKEPVKRTARNAKLLDLLADQLFGQPTLA